MSRVLLTHDIRLLFEQVQTSEESDIFCANTVLVTKECNFKPPFTYPPNINS